MSCEQQGSQWERSKVWVARDGGGKNTVFWNLHASAKEMSIFQSPLNYAIEKFSLKWFSFGSELISNVMTWYTLIQKKNLTEFYFICLLMDGYTQLKLQVQWINIRICQYFSVWKNIFKDEIPQIFLCMSINRWTFALDMMIGSIEFCQISGKVFFFH